ncbi:hypothetical protein G3435_06230 [Pseudomonas sp. MAFF212428]|uniref:FAS1-like dehydratase domain-containing protein n=1 Tax=Pseudomonas brassicae TaxID=2708063 RepID=A0A6B3P379_9PSED|nr:MaoC family dehydratase N-terminal domain-containing protein [Pseudomonas brassicae]NER59700.1 hypothetical protein [Pseudomonas brassicae]NER66357.1 hypothetical protein [Pseudomonas brassicae]
MHRSELIISQDKCNTFAALAGTAVESAPAAGAALALGWHMLYLHETDPWLEPGVDGHPEARPHGVPAQLDKRMWASSQVELFAPIRVGEQLTLLRQPPAVTLKQGASGALAFVNEVTQVRRGDTTLLSETKTLVYRSATRPQRAGGAPAGPVQVPAAVLQKTVNLNEVTLFRYSSVLGVAHRIHYDYPYATAHEGYPGLLIHGPLIIQLLLDLYRPTAAGERPVRYQARGIRPNFLGSALTLNMGFHAEQVVLWASDQDHQPTLLIHVSA